MSHTYCPTCGYRFGTSMRCPTCDALPKIVYHGPVPLPCQGCLQKDAENASLREQLVRQTELTSALETANAFVVGWLLAPKPRAEFPEERFQHYLEQIGVARVHLVEVEDI